MAPALEKLAEGLRGAVRVAAVNCAKHQSLCAKNRVSSYPTIKIIGPGGAQDYRGPRSAKAMRNAAAAAVPADAVRVLGADRAESLDKARERFCTGSGADGRPQVCVVVLSPRGEASLLLRSVAAAMADKEAAGRSKRAEVTFLHLDTGRSGQHAAVAARAFALDEPADAASSTIALVHAGRAVPHAREAPTFGMLTSWLSSGVSQLLGKRRRQ